MICPHTAFTAIESTLHTVTESIHYTQNLYVMLLKYLLSDSVRCRLVLAGERSHNDSPPL